MLLPVAALSTVLAVFSDEGGEGSTVEIEESFLRAQVLGDPSIFIQAARDRGLVYEEIETVVADWLRASPSLDALFDRISFGMFTLRTIRFVNMMSSRHDVDSQIAWQVLRPAGIYGIDPQSTGEYAQLRDPRLVMPVFGGRPVDVSTRDNLEQRLKRRQLQFEKFKQEGLQVFDFKHVFDPASLLSLVERSSGDVQSTEIDETWIFSWDDRHVLVEIGPTDFDFETSLAGGRSIHPTSVFVLLKRDALEPFEIWPEDRAQDEEP